MASIHNDPNDWWRIKVSLDDQRKYGLDRAQYWDIYAQRSKCFHTILELKSKLAAVSKQLEGPGLTVGQQLKLKAEVDAFDWLKTQLRARVRELQAKQLEVSPRRCSQRIGVLVQSNSCLL